jgi:PAS domain S-box-containing protein
MNELSRTQASRAEGPVPRTIALNDLPMADALVTALRAYDISPLPAGSAETPGLVIAVIPTSVDASSAAFDTHDCLMLSDDPKHRIAALTAGATAVLPLSAPVEEIAAKADALLKRLARERRMQQELDTNRRREDHLLLAMEKALAITFEWDIRTDEVRRLQSTESAFPATGASTDKFADLAKHIHPDDRALFTRNVNLAFTHPEGSYSSVFRVQRPDGSVGWLSEKGRVGFDSEGKPQRLVGISLDITDRMRATEEISRLAAAMEIAFEGAEAAPWSYNISTRVTDWTQRNYELLGLDPRSGPGSMDIFLERVHADDRAKLRAAREAERDSEPGARFKIQLRIVKPSGEIRWIERRSVVGHDEPGGRRVYGIDIDITEQRGAEEEVKRGKALLDTIFESAPIGLAMWDRNFRFLRVNRALADMNGLAPDDHIGKRPDELLPDLDVASVYDRWQNILDTGEPWLEVEVSGETPAAPGHIRSWIENFFPLKSGSEVIGIGAIVEEVTERRRTEERIHQQGRLLDQSQEPILVWELGGRITLWNRGAAQLYGWNAGEAVGRISHELLATRHPTALDAFEVMLRREGSWVGELQQRTRDGTPITVESRQEIMTSADGRILVLETNRDITERKRAEEKIRLLMREVNHRSKNLLAVVQAVANQTARGRSPQDFALRFGERLLGLAASHDLLVHNAWRGVDLGDLITSQLSHFRDIIGRQISLDGPKLQITAATAQSLGMALHELTTNAAKHGALSSRKGRLEIRWQITGEGEEARLHLRWKETDGPPVSQPQVRGFGTRVLVDMTQAALAGKVTLDYLPGGLLWEITAPVENLLEHPDGEKH